IPSDRRPRKGIDRIVVGPKAVVKIGADVQPAKQLDVAGRPERMPRSEALARPRLVAVHVVHVEVTLTREEESKARRLKPFVSALGPVVPVLAPEKRIDLHEAESIPSRWIKVQRGI